MTEVAQPRRASVAGFHATASGVTPPSDRSRQSVFLGDLIVELGFADRETMDAVEEGAREAGKTFEQYLLDCGVLDEQRLVVATAERHGLDHVDLDRFDVDAEAARLVPRAVALRYTALPIAFAADGALIVAVKDPFDSLGISDIEVMTKNEVRRVIATASGITDLIERLLGESPPAEPGPNGAAPPPRPAPQPRPESQPEAQAEPEPQPEAQAEPEPEPEPEPEAAPTGELGALSTELRALGEAARRADALVAGVLQRIEVLEGAEERAQRLERELAATRDRAEELERQLAGVTSAAETAIEATDKLVALRRVIEDSGAGSP